MPEPVLDFVKTTSIAVKQLNIQIPERDEEYAYEMGFDCEKNGADMTNCHFSIFSSEANMKAWERGRQDAAAKRLKE